MTHQGMAPEHDFSVDRDEWETTVFNNAQHFSVVLLEKNLSKPVATFPQAVIEATADERSLIYAVTETGRFVCLDRKDHDKFLRMWAERVNRVAREAIAKTPKKATKQQMIDAAMKALRAMNMPDNEAEIVAGIAVLMPRIG